MGNFYSNEINMYLFRIEVFDGRSFFMKFLTFLTSLAFHHLWSDSLSSGLYAHPSPLSIVTITSISYTS